MIDQKFAELAIMFVKSSAADRSEMIATLPTSDGPALLMLGGRATEASLWDLNPKHLDHALAAHCMEDFRSDPRDNIVLLAAIWYAGERLGVSPGPLFFKFADLASENGRKHLHEFAARSKSQKSLAAMGFQIVRDEGRPRFRPLPPPWRRSGKGSR
jgi:hypothetical protein